MRDKISMSCTIIEDNTKRTVKSSRGLLEGESIHDELGHAAWFGVLQPLNVGRVEQVVAVIVEKMSEEERHDYGDERTEILDELFSAATRLLDYWKRNDKALRDRVTL